MSLSDLTGLAGLTFTAVTAACQRATVKRCAGTAGVPPATHRRCASLGTWHSIRFRASRSLRAGRPRSRQITWPFLCIRLRCALSPFVVIITVSY